MAVFHRLKGWQIARHLTKTPESRAPKFFDDLTPVSSISHDDELDRASNASSPSSSASFSHSSHMVNAALTLLAPERELVGEYAVRVMVDGNDSPLVNTRFGDSLLLFNDLMVWAQFQPTASAQTASDPIVARSRANSAHVLKDKQTVVSRLFPLFPFL